MNSFKEQLISDSWAHVMHIPLLYNMDDIKSLYRYNNTIDTYNGCGYKLPYNFTLLSSVSCSNIFHHLSCVDLQTNGDATNTSITNTIANTCTINTNSYTSNLASYIACGDYTISSETKHNDTFADDIEKTHISRICANYDYLIGCDKDLNNTLLAKTTELNNKYGFYDIVYAHSNNSAFKFTLTAARDITVLACCNITTNVSQSHWNDTIPNEIITTLYVGNDGVDSVGTQITGYSKRWFQTTGGCDSRDEALTQKIYGTKNILLFGTKQSVSGEVSVRLQTNNTAAIISDVSIIVLNGRHFTTEVSN